jgi:hypothetical protein
MTTHRPPTPQQVYRQLLELLKSDARDDWARAGGEPAGSPATYLLHWLHLLEPERSQP